MRLLDLENWSQLRLEEPFWLLLLLFIPFIVWIRTKKRFKPTTIRFPSISRIQQIKDSRLLFWAKIPNFLIYICMVFLILSLCKPQLDRSVRQISSSGVDIVLAVDLSASMLALDMSDNELGEVTRLDVVKGVIKNFINKREHDRMGLVAFSVNPYLVSALTLDTEHLNRNLDRLRVGLTLQTGTNIGSALAEGINRLRNLESKSKVLILLTDGKDEPPPPHSPLIFAEGARKDGIKIYTIAIGSNSRTRTYLFDPSTRDIMKYENGNPVIQVADYPVDKDILKRISEKTGGLYFEAKNQKSLIEIYDEIDRLEKTEVNMKINAFYEDLFQWPLAFSAATFIIGVVLNRTLFLRIP